MSLFRRGRGVCVSYDEDKTNMNDLHELRNELAGTFRERPKTYKGKKKLSIIHTGMLGPDGKLKKPIFRKAEQNAPEVEKTEKKEVRSRSRLMKRLEKYSEWRDK